MRILIVGGTGLLGQRLLPHLGGKHEVTVTTRSAQRPSHLPEWVQVLQWDTKSPFPGDGPYDAIVSLAGASLVGKRWTDDYKRTLRRSRIETNTHLSEWVQARDEPPSVFLTASAVGIYGARPAGPVDESSPLGEDFLARLCQDWEAAAAKASSDQTRVVRSRFGVMLDPQGGALAELLWVFRLGLGGKVGDGRQPFPWVHIDDVARYVATALEDDRYRGAINVVAPDEDTNATFTKKLGQALHRPTPMWVPPLALRLRYGDAAELVTDGQTVRPARLEELGFEWMHTELQAALEHLLSHEGHPHVDQASARATSSKKKPVRS